MVPPPHEWPGFIQKVHLELGHFGVKRTYSLFSPHYHWRGMYVQIWNVIVRCEQCDRVRTSFSSWQLTLFPLPNQGMFYCWSCDFARKLPQSRGNVYIMIMIEHFSKWVKFVALPNKSSHNTNQVFLQYDALPTPWRTQMWVQVKDNGRRRSRDALPSSQHLRGRGACWSSGMGLGRIDKLIHSHGPACNPHKVVSA
jgi:hypothetical protein